MLIASLLIALQTVAPHPVQSTNNNSDIVIRETPVSRTYAVSTRTTCGDATFEIEIVVDGETSRVAKATINGLETPVLAGVDALDQLISRSRVVGVSPSFCSPGSPSVRLAVATYSSQQDAEEASDGGATLIATMGDWE
jgi:hypothetical protein